MKRVICLLVFVVTFTACGAQTAQSSTSIAQADPAVNSAEDYPAIATAFKEDIRVALKEFSAINMQISEDLSKIRNRDPEIHALAMEATEPVKKACQPVLAMQEADFPDEYRQSFLNLYAGAEQIDQGMDLFMEEIEAGETGQLWRALDHAMNGYDMVLEAAQLLTEKPWPPVEPEE